MLFLDELPEFPRNVLELLRQPLEDGSVTIARATMTLSFPASFMLVAAMNPCPCGFYGDPTRECRCTGAIIQRYLGKISGPLLDRIDLHIEVPAVAYKELRGKDRARILRRHPRAASKSPASSSTRAASTTPTSPRLRFASSARSTTPASAPSKWPSAAWVSPPAPTTAS